MALDTPSKIAFLLPILLTATLTGCGTPSLLTIGAADVNEADYQGLVSVPDVAEETDAETLLLRPVEQSYVSSAYGMRLHPVYHEERLHDGVDFAAVEGSPILAAGDGEIVQAGPLGSYGNYVRIRHSATCETAYAHLDGIAEDVQPGERVEQGDIIGYVGATGLATGPHLHYEVALEGEPINPLDLARTDTDDYEEAEDNGPTLAANVSGKLADWYQVAHNGVGNLKDATVSVYDGMKGLVQR